MESPTVQLNSESSVDSNPTITKKNPTKKEVQTWIVNNVAELIEEKPDRIKMTIPFDRYGLDSIAAYQLTGDLETWLDRELDPTLMYNYPTIESLTQHLVEELKN